MKASPPQAPHRACAFGSCMLQDWGPSWEQVSVNGIFCKIRLHCPCMFTHAIVHGQNCPQVELSMGEIVHRWNCPQVEYSAIGIFHRQNIPGGTFLGGIFLRWTLAVTKRNAIGTVFIAYNCDVGTELIFVHELK